MRLNTWLVLIPYSWNFWFAESTEPCSIDTSVNISSGEKIGNGSIAWEDLIFEEEHIFLDENGTLRGCICFLKNCLRHCCPPGHSVVLDTIICAPVNFSTDEIFNRITVGGEDDSNKSVEIDHKTHFHHLYSMLKCRPIMDTDDTILITTPNGKILYDETNVNHEDYCLYVKNDSINFNAYACASDNSYIQYFVDLINGIGMIISLPFLLATLMVYCFVPELHRSFQGKTLMAYVSALFMSYLLLVYSKLSTLSTNMKHSTICIILGFAMYFFTLLSFFWLNVMSFDIWLTFRKMECARNRSAGNKRFLLYSCYALGMSLLFTGICVLIDYTPNLPETMILPGIASNCWFNEDDAQLYYIFLPIAIIINVNILFFIITTIKILKIKRETSVLRNDESARHSQFDKDKQRFYLYLKLFMIMGVTWTAEWIGFFVEANYYLFIIADLFNALVGVFIFMIFVNKKNVKKMVVRRSRRLFQHMGSMNSTQSRSENRTEKITLPED